MRRNTLAEASESNYPATIISSSDSNYTAAIAPSHSSTQSSNLPSIPAPTAGDYVSGEKYRHALTNFAIAHQKVEEQRFQLEEQRSQLEEQRSQLEERGQQIARLQTYIKTLEGSSSSNQSVAGTHDAGESSVIHFSINTAASQLERTINRWAGEILRVAPVPPATLRDAVLVDICIEEDTGLFTEARPMLVQSLLRHAMAEAISDGFMNTLIVTSVADANIQLTRIHESLFARDPIVAAVWRRQMFISPVGYVAPETMQQIFEEYLPSLAILLQDQPNDAFGTRKVFEDAYRFSRMLHSAPADTFYRSFVPEVGSTPHPHRVELVKRCRLDDLGEVDRVGVTIFPGLVKLSPSRNPQGPLGGSENITTTVVRRAQVICKCALQATSYPTNAIVE